MRTAAILLIAGASNRFDAAKSKQVYLLKNKPVFSYPLEEFAKSKLIDDIVVVVNNKVIKEVKTFIEENKINAKVILGGSTRQKSVENGLDSLQLSKDDIVIVHDGARPLLNKKIIKDVIAGAKKYDAATTYINEVDTVALIDEDGLTKKFVNRDKVAKIQTPQAFKYGLLKLAHSKAKSGNATDDCSLVANLGIKIKLIPGSNRLHKITTIDDIRYLEGLVK